jgi:DNA-binding CsgD family transcriptional regulator
MDAVVPATRNGVDDGPLPWDPEGVSVEVESGGSELRSPELLERERELAVLAGLVEDARAGRGRLVAVEAPPGLGKSTLLAYAGAAAAEAGVLVLRAAGRELERELGWGVARSLFEAWLIGLSDGDRDEMLAGPAAGAGLLFGAELGADGPAGRDVGFALLRGLFWLTVHASQRRPVLLVVDDAQWADEPSLRFLLYLVGRVADQPVGVLVAARSGEAGAGGLLVSLLSDPAASVHALAPLSRDAVGAVVRARARDADDAFCARCFELTAGNPLFVRELVRPVEPAKAADVSGIAERAATSLQRLVLRRLASLSDDGQALARAVAVFEGGITLEVAAALAGLDADRALQAADELARVDILRAGDPLEFVHPLLRAAVYGALGRHERTRVHGRAARVLRERGALAEQVGTHLLEAVPCGDGAAVDALRAAGAAALAHGVPVSAIAYLERALREPPTDGVGAEVLAELGRAELLAGRREAVEHLRLAIDLTAEARQRAALRLELGRTLHDFGRLEEACTACEQGLEELGDSADDEVGLDLQAWWLTSAMILVGRAEEAQRRAAAVLARPPASTRAGRTLESKAMNLRLYAGGTPHGGTAREVSALARRLWAGGRLLADDGLVTQAVVHVGGALSYCDDYQTAQAVLEAVLGRARREGWVTWIAGACQLLSRQELWTGPLGDAVEDARIAFEIFAEGMQLYLPATGYCLARGLLEAGAFEEAEAVLVRVDAGGEPVGMFGGWRAEVAGRLAAQRRDPEAALHAFLASGECLRGGVSNPGMFHWRSEAGLAALRTGDRTLAERLIAEELAMAERFGAPRAVGVARRAAGLLARGEEAVGLLRSAADLHAKCGAGLERALSLTELGAAIRRAGRPGEARAVLRNAISLADRLGARPLGARAREQLALAGGRAPAARDPASDLTPSEGRVAELAAAGRTNRQIADELFVTVKAVEWHLGNAYRKLDIRGRGQLAAALAAQAGPDAQSGMGGSR